MLHYEITDDFTKYSQGAHAAHCRQFYLANMPQVPPSWNRDPVKTGLILLLIMISPIGAPLLALITIDACDLPWEGSYECFVPEPVFAYFMLSLVRPFFWFGSFALIWFALSISVLTGFVWMCASAALAALTRD